MTEPTPLLHMRKARPLGDGLFLVEVRMGRVVMQTGVAHQDQLAEADRIATGQPVPAALRQASVDGMLKAVNYARTHGLDPL